MTFKEAIKFRDSISPGMVENSIPVRMVLDSIVAPEGSNLETLTGIFDKIKDEQLANADILSEMGFFGDNLTLFVVFKIKGLIYFRQYQDYLELEDGNLS